MNASQFMDKQITALSAQGSGGGNLLDLINAPQKDDHNRHSSGEDGGQKEDIVPSYDFQPIRPTPPLAVEGSRGSAWGSLDPKLPAAAATNPRNYSLPEMHASSRIIPEKSKEAYEIDVVAEFDRTVKRHTDDLLSALESLSSRLTQLETRTCHLESSVDDLKFAVGNHTGSTDGKLRQLEIIMKEVQAGVQVLRDKHDILESQLQLSKLQPSSGEKLSTTQVEPQKPAAPPQLPQQQPQPSIASLQPTVPPMPSIVPPMPPTVPAPLPTAIPAPPVPLAPNILPPQQNLPVPYTPPAPQSQMPPVPSHEQPYGPPQEQPHQYPLPAGGVAPPPSLKPVQPYQMLPQIPRYPPPQSQHQPSFAPHSEETPQFTHSSPPYPSSVRPLTSGPPPQQFYGPSPNVYENPAGKPMPSAQAPYSDGYNPPSMPGFKEPFPYGPPPPHYTRQSSFSSSSPPSGGSNYSRLPTAQLLPQAVPTGSNSSSSGPSGNRVPIDDVVEKVATMGFSRDQVRATVRKLTENGQSVDLNVVLDKLMNGSDMQPQKAWYGR